MKRNYLLSSFAAAILHGVLLFGFRMGSVAKSLPIANNFIPMEVSLVEVPSSRQTEDELQPEPEPTPEPMAAILTEPEKSEASLPSPTPNPLHSTLIPVQKRSLAQPSASSRPVLIGKNLLGSSVMTQPGYRSNPSPAYPIDARRFHQQGLVLLNVEVGANGQPHEVILKKSSGFRSLDEAAIQTVRRWTFEPASAGGRPITSRVDVPVKFSILN